MKSILNSVRKSIAMALAMILLAGVFNFVSAADYELIPIRAAFEDRGGEVLWNDENRSIHVTMDGSTFIFYVDEQVAYVNTFTLTLQDGVTIAQDRAFISNADFAQAMMLTQRQIEEIELFVGGGVITGALHRVEYGGNAAYIFGSLHAERAGWFPLADIVENAMRRADVFAFELDFTDIEGIVDAIDSFLFWETPVSEVISPELFAQYIEALASFGIGEEDALYINPAMLINDLTMMLIAEVSDVEMGGLEVTVDWYVFDFALARGLPVIGLEPPMQQVRLLHDPPLEVVEFLIRHFHPRDVMIADILAIAEYEIMSLDMMADLYEANDFAGLVELMHGHFDPETETPQERHMRETVANYRSVYYANEILRLLRETGEPTTFFITIGASHIIRSWAGEGFTDIIAELRLQGVEAIELF